MDLIADICSLPLKESTADMVICTEVLEHVRDTEKALENLNRVIKKGGYLILSTPLLVGEHGYTDYFRFTESALRYYLEKYGFEILVFKRRGGIFSALYAILRFLPREVLITTNTNANLQKNQKQEKNKKESFCFLDILFIILSTISIPFKNAFILLDRIDKNKKFTSG